MRILEKQTDSVLDVLNMVYEFTQLRARVLHKNIINANNKNYRPADLDASTFAELMAQALSEYLISSRLLFVDSENIKFGTDGTFQALEVTDTTAARLLKKNRKQYLKQQMEMISENQANKNAAAHLIEKRQSQNSYLTQ